MAAVKMRKKNPLTVFPPRESGPSGSLLSKIRKVIKEDYMKIVRNATAGTLESSDIFICAEPAEELSVEIQSVVAEQYLKEITDTFKEVLEQFNVKSGLIRANDRGALDCVIRARLETVLIRGGEKS